VGVESKDPGINVALARGFKVLQAFRQGEIYLGNMEISRRTGIPKATVSRITHTLRELGYLNFSYEVEKYQISPGILSLAYAVFSSHEIQIYARPLMQRMAEETQSTVGLAVRDGLGMVYLDYAKTRSSQTYDTSIGLKVPIVESAIGWSYLAMTRSEERDALLQEIEEGLSARERKSVRSHLDRGLKDVWEKGYCISYGDRNPQTNAVGVPLVMPNRSEIYAFNCIGPVFQFTDKVMTNEIAPRLLGLAEELRMGGSNSLTASVG
jgi:DNA-binding IclR family transcriptional regulator